jgi:FHA domain
VDLYLAILAGVTHERAVPLPVGCRLLLGRHNLADVALDSIYVNRRHCEVGRDKDGVWAKDLESGNGTSLNGNRISVRERTAVQPGGQLRMANVQAAIVRVDLSWLAWNDGVVKKLAQVVSEEQSYHRLPLLADALEDAGCTDLDILNHCRQAGEHVRGCWVVDLLLGKA